jgi:hypothetical protein
MAHDIASMLLDLVWTILAWAWSILDSAFGFFLVILLSLPIVAASSEQQSFPDITFKVFNDFVSQHFSSRVSLATVLLGLFSLTENPDLHNLHSRQKTSLLHGENKQSTSGWIKALACALTEQLGRDTKTLFKHNTLSKDWSVDSVTDSIASKLDLMAELIDLIPVYTERSSRVKHKLTTVLHQKIAAIHVIYPSVMEFNESHCNHWALQQDTRTRDIPQVTLIKGTTIYKNVYVLSGLCIHCNTKYYADHKGINQI